MASNDAVAVIDVPTEKGDVKDAQKEESKENRVEEANKPDTPVDDAKPGSSGEDDAEPSSLVEEDTRERVEFKVIYNKVKHDISFPLDETVTQFKKHLATITSVPETMQKLMFKGKLNDDATLRESNLTKGAKVMLVGSTVNEVMGVAAPDMKALKAEMAKEEASQKTTFSKQKQHKTVLEKHKKPEDVMIGVKNKKEKLPPCPITGMYNKSGGKVRLTFKLELDQLWIGTKDRTDKIPMNSIKNVVNEPIHDHEEYHIMAIQLGPTEASRYFIYWVPAQYVDAIKDGILGQWEKM